MIRHALGLSPPVTRPRSPQRRDTLVAMRRGERASVRNSHKDDTEQGVDGQSLPLRRCLKSTAAALGSSELTLKASTYCDSLHTPAPWSAIVGKMRSKGRKGGIGEPIVI